MHNNVHTLPKVTVYKCTAIKIFTTVVNSFCTFIYIPILYVSDFKIIPLMTFVYQNTIRIICNLYYVYNTYICLLLCFRVILSLYKIVFFKGNLKPCTKKMIFFLSYIRIPISNSTHWINDYVSRIFKFWKKSRRKTARRCTMYYNVYIDVLTVLEFETLYIII